MYVYMYIVVNPIVNLEFRGWFYYWICHIISISFWLIECCNFADRWIYRSMDRFNKKKCLILACFVGCIPIPGQLRSYLGVETGRGVLMSGFRFPVFFFYLHTHNININPNICVIYIYIHIYIYIYYIYVCAAKHFFFSVKRDCFSGYPPWIENPNDGGLIIPNMPWYTVICCNISYCTIITIIMIIIL